MTETPSKKRFEDATMPLNLTMSARGFADENYAKAAMSKIHSVMSVLSTNIDLSDLDGVTVSFEYDQSLLELDRGYESSYELRATNDVAIGVAMAPRVMRNDKLKSHLVLNAQYVLSIVAEPGEENAFFPSALHLLAHECAHVEVTKKFEDAFPKWLLRHAHENVLDNLRWQVILAVWDEYAVCRIVADTGEDPIAGYLETLTEVLESTRVKCVDAIISYRNDADVEKVVYAVYGAMGDLLKYTSYFVGAVKGVNRNLAEFSDFQAQLNDSWYRPFFDELVAALDDLFVDYGTWSSFDGFEQLGDIVENMAEEIGIYAERSSDQDIYFEIPYRSETMP